VLNVVEQTHGRIAVLAVAGHLDSATAPEFTALLLGRLARRQTRMVLDLAGVGFASSAGLRAVLIGVVLKVLEMSGFTKLIQTSNTVTEAVKSFE
jgi:anti-anti-sigma factor